MIKPLKLRAEDADDIKVLAACLQDAIMPIGDMCFLPDEHRFVMVLNRFKWEDCGDGRLPPAAGPSVDEEDVDCPYERTHCGVRIEGIRRVLVRGIDQHDRHQILELLTMEVDHTGLTLRFAGGGCIHLESDHWRCVAEDVGEPWPTSRRPSHALDD